MGNRYGRRDSGRRDRPTGGGYRASFEHGSSFGDRSGYGREENYFGSGRQQFGGGFSGTNRSGYGAGERFEEHGQNYDDRDRGTYSGRSRDELDRSDFRGRSASGGRGGYDREHENERYQGSRGYREDDDYNEGPTGGMIGGGFGGYMGGGYQGYNPGDQQNRGRSQGGWSGYGGANYGRGESGGERDYEGYNQSTRGYERGRDDDRGFFERVGDQVSSWFGGEDYEEGRSHRGRGPRNYSRSDDRIRDDVNDRLTDSHFIDASDIEVEVNGGDVILSGSVDSRYAKRMAEDIVESVSGVRNVENRIRVNQNWGQGYSQTTTGSTQTSSSGDADLATGSGTTGRTGTTGSVSGTTGTAGSTGNSRGSAAGSSDS